MPLGTLKVLLCIGGIVDPVTFVDGLRGSFSFLNLYILVSESPLDLRGHGELTVREPDLDPRV